MDYFNQLPSRERGYFFKYLKNKSYQIFKNNLDSDSREYAFPYLEKKSLEAFKDIYHKNNVSNIPKKKIQKLLN